VTDAALQLRLLGFVLPDVIACLADKRERIRWNVRAVGRLAGEYNGALSRMDGSAVSGARGGVVSVPCDSLARRDRDGRFSRRVHVRDARSNSGAGSRGGGGCAA